MKLRGPMFGLLWLALATTDATLAQALPAVGTPPDYSVNNVLYPTGSNLNPVGIHLVPMPDGTLEVRVFATRSCVGALVAYGFLQVQYGNNSWANLYYSSIISPYGTLPPGATYLDLGYLAPGIGVSSKVVAILKHPSGSFPAGTYRLLIPGLLDAGGWANCATGNTASNPTLSYYEIPTVTIDGAPLFALGGTIRVTPFQEIGPSGLVAVGTSTDFAGVSGTGTLPPLLPQDGIHSDFVSGWPIKYYILDLKTGVSFVSGPLASNP